MQPENFPKAKYSYAVKAKESGYIVGVDTESYGEASLLLGAGRNTKEDVIDNILERLDYIVLIQNINNSKISLEKIKLIKDSMEIINTYEDIEKI